MPDLRNLRSIAALAASYPGLFSEAKIRHFVRDANRNGFAGAIVRVGTRIFIDAQEFEAWVAGKAKQRVDNG